MSTRRELRLQKIIKKLRFKSKRNLVIFVVLLALVVPVGAWGVTSLTIMEPGDVAVLVSKDGCRIREVDSPRNRRDFVCVGGSTSTSTSTSTNTSTTTSTSTTTTTTTAPPVPTDTQPPQLVTGGNQWAYIFNENFEGTALNTTRWNVLTASDAKWGSGNFSPNNVSVHGGSLHLLGKQDRSTGGVTTRSYGRGQKFAFTHGYIEARIKMPAGSWWWPAFWLVGDNASPGWPCYGEFDVMEWYGPRPDQYEATTHWCPNGTSGHSKQGGVGIKYATGTTAQDWHTYGLWWTSTSLKYFLDGKMVQQFNPIDSGSQQALQYGHTIIVDQQMGDGSFNGSATLPPASFPDGDYQVDYVKVWKP